MSTRIASLLFLVLFCGPAIAGETEALVKGRDAAAILHRSLQERLEAAASRPDPSDAFAVCSYQAQALTGEVEQRMGVRLKRTSLKLRNPKNAPDAFENGVLDRFASVARAGVLPDELFEEGVFEGKKAFRFARPIVVGASCMTCHGISEEIPPEIRKLLNERYPQDRATGYRPGDLRGIVSVVIPSE